MSLGENIYKLRSKKNWSQTDLADALEVSRQSVSKWENNTATPDLERLIKMKEIFDISLDELVFGDVFCQKGKTDVSERIAIAVPSHRVIAGITMLIFGMIFFLLSIFWGDHLYLGEAFGELFSATLVLISIAMISPYDFRVFAVCTIIFFVYSVICFCFLNINNNMNSLFTFIASIVIVVWFIVCGKHNSKIEREKEKQEDSI
jgi:transcriptional regulator with XRE-family HTH domain